MYKLILIAMIATVLAGCGNESGAVSNDIELAQDEEFYTFDLKNATDDFMAFATDDNHDVLVLDGWDEYKKVATYSGDTTSENGVYTVNVDGYEETLRYMLIEDYAHTLYIAVVGEQINGTDQTLYPYGDWEFITDTMEHISPYSGSLSGEYAPNTRHQGMTMAELNYQDDMPTEINVTTPPVYNVDSAGDFYMDDHYIDPKEFTLTIDD